MKPSLQQVLVKLIIKGHKGVTWDDFPLGKHLSKRFSELRDKGYNITDTWETLPSGCRRKRYYYLGKKK